jgi:hypothetical protein
MGNLRGRSEEVKLFEMTVLPIDALRKAPWNYKTDDPKLAEKLRANMERNGQLENIVVRQMDDESFEVVNGNHRYDAMVALGWTHATVLDLGPITTMQAQRIAIELNETRFASNPQALSELLVGLVDSFGEKDLVFTSPFSAEEMKILTDPTLFMPPPDPAPSSEFSEGGHGGEHHPKLETPFTFTLRFHERDLIEWMTHLKNLREGYEVTRNEDALMILARSFSSTCVESVEGFQKVIGLLPPGVQENLKATEQHIAQRLDEDGRGLIEDPHLRLGQIIEILCAEYMASFGS